MPSGVSAILDSVYRGTGSLRKQCVGDKRRGKSVCTEEVSNTPVESISINPSNRLVQR
jgi:hypothetical protein